MNYNIRSLAGVVDKSLKQEVKMTRLMSAHDRQIDLHNSIWEGKKNRSRPDKARWRKGSIAGATDHPHKLV
jgi:hypothetical protein